MSLQEQKKMRDENIPRHRENFRKRALVIALFMAVSGLIFLGAVLRFTGWLEIF